MASTKGASARTTKDLRVRARMYQGGSVVTDLLKFSVMTELAHPVSRKWFLGSRQGFGQMGLLCCDTFWDRDSGAALWVGFVSLHDFLCRDSGASG